MSMSFRASVVHEAMKILLVKKRISSLSLDQLRSEVQDAERLFRFPKGVVARSGRIAGIRGEWFKPRRVRSSGAILYLHGGAYKLGSIRSHRALAARLAEASGLRTLAIDYLLAPEHPYPQALKDAMLAYLAMCEAKLGPIAVAGDSAGGGLAFALALTLHERGAMPPVALVAMSPWTDLTLTSQTHKLNANVDPFFRGKRFLAKAAEDYRGTYSATEPLISPLYGDLSHLPPTLIHVGEREVLLDDSRLFAAAAERQGASVKLQVWPDMWHGWQLFHDRIPEADASIEDMGAFLRAAVNPQAQNY